MKLKSGKNLKQYILHHRGVNILRKWMHSVQNHRFSRQENQEKNGEK